MAHPGFVETWLTEQRAAAKRQETRRYCKVLGWTIVAAVAASVAAWPVITNRLDSTRMHDRSVVSVILTIPLGILSLVLLIDLGFRPGTKGPNRFGPDPLGNQV